MRRTLQIVVVSGAILAAASGLWPWAGSSFDALVPSGLFSATGTGSPAGASNDAPRSTPPFSGSERQQKPVGDVVRALHEAHDRVSSPGRVEQLKIEVARIVAGGVSVLAGRAPPDSKVTVLANGREVAHATASAEGQWSVVVDEAIGAGQLELRLRARSPKDGSALQSASVRLVVAADESGATSARSTTRRPTDALPRTLVSDARRSTASTDLERFEAVVARARTAPAGTEARPRTLPPLPVPITFETNADAMTRDGAKAAALLAEYLRLTRPDSITLSGHADSRGGNDYNLDLSRQRLEAIERYLRANGYRGRLALLPKGKSEPFRGIDRVQASREVIWQADRRVELHISR